MVYSNSVEEFNTLSSTRQGRYTSVATSIFLTKADDRQVITPSKTLNGTKGK